MPKSNEPTTPEIKELEGRITEALREMRTEVIDVTLEGITIADNNTNVIRLAFATLPVRTLVLFLAIVKRQLLAEQLRRKIQSQHPASVGISKPDPLRASPDIPKRSKRTAFQIDEIVSIIPTSGGFEVLLAGEIKTVVSESVGNHLLDVLDESDDDFFVSQLTGQVQR